MNITNLEFWNIISLLPNRLLNPNVINTQDKYSMVNNYKILFQLEQPFTYSLDVTNYLFECLNLYQLSNLGLIKKYHLV
jgi:hypothetical protein